MTTGPDLSAFAPPLHRASRMAKQARVGVYDCLYVALAERRDCQLITDDDRLVPVLQPSYPFIMTANFQGIVDVRHDPR